MSMVASAIPSHQINQLASAIARRLGHSGDLVASKIEPNALPAHEESATAEATSRS